MGVPVKTFNKLKSKKGKTVASNPNAKWTKTIFLMMALQGTGFLAGCVLFNVGLLLAVHFFGDPAKNHSNASEMEYTKWYLRFIWLVHLVIGRYTLPRITFGLQNAVEVVENDNYFLHEESINNSFLKRHGVIQMGLGILGLVMVYFSNLATETGSPFNIYSFVAAQLVFAAGIAVAAVLIEKDILRLITEHAIQLQQNVTTLEYIAPKNKKSKRTRAAEPIKLYY